MLTHPNIDPVALSLGPVKIHWYGIMYLLGFAAFWYLARLRARKPWSPLRPEQVDDLLFYGAMGVIVGGRLGSMLFYNFDTLLADPWSLFRVWEGGMSFHGGMLGVIVAVWLYARKLGRSLLEITDFGAPMVPIGLGAGRIGNFINGELWGKPTDLPWGMVFQSGGPLPRHPSQLYEFLLEGVVLFVVLWLYSARPRPTGAVSALFLVCYGLFRFVVEFVREPDANIGYLAWGWLTMGQLLSLPMILAGAGLYLWAQRQPLRGDNS